MNKFELIYKKQDKRKIDINHLKPCPFCNGKAELSGMFPSGQYYIECSECRASIWEDRKDKVIGHWNMRNGQDDICNSKLSENKQTLKELRNKLENTFDKNTFSVEHADDCEVDYTNKDNFINESIEVIKPYLKE